MSKNMNNQGYGRERLTVLAIAFSSILTIAALLATPVISTAQTFSSWSKAYGTATTDDDLFRGLVNAVDGDGYLLAGQIQDNGDENIILTRVAENGSLLWQKTIAGTKTDNIRSAIALPDDDAYVLVGATNSQGAGKQDVYVAKVDADGNVISQYAYGSSSLNEYVHFGDAADNGAFVLGGYIQTGTGNKDYFGMKLNSDLTVAWAKKYIAGSSDDVIRAVRSLSDGSVMFAGWTKSLGSQGDWLVVRANGTDGSIIWSKTYGGNGFEEPADIVELANGDILVVEESRSFTNSVDGWIIRIDKDDGSLIWQKTYGGSNFDELSSAVLVDNGTAIMMTGETRVNGQTLEDYIVVKVNVTDGSMISGYRQGGSGWDEAEDIVATEDGGFVVAGHSNSTFVSGMLDTWVLKVDSTGQLVNCDCDAGVTTENVALNWNVNNSNASPVTASLTVTNPTMTRTTTTLSVSDTTGDVDETPVCE